MTTIKEPTVLFHLDEVIVSSEKKLFQYISQNNYEQCEEVLTNFCLELIVLPEKEEILVARIFFRGIITHFIRKQVREGYTQSKTLTMAFEIISTIEQWDNISEYILHIPWFIDRLQTEIITSPVYKDNAFVEKALQLISSHLPSKHLTVKWLANQLGITTTHLSNLFKLHIGENISQFIAKRKIQDITYQMIHSNSTLKNIRETYGFTNHSHFIQFFKKHQGITPLQYIREHLLSK